MESALIIRKAEKSDAKEMLEYLRRVGGETDNLSFGKEGLPFLVEQQAEYIGSRGERNLFIVALRDGKIVGDASLDVLPRRMSHRAELGIAVVKGEWGKGIGTRMMEMVIEHARRHGIEVVSLEVRRDNERAIGLYEKFGFRRIGTFEKFFKIGDEYVDFELMTLDVTQ